MTWRALPETDVRDPCKTLRDHRLTSPDIKSTLLYIDLTSPSHPNTWSDIAQTRSCTTKQRLTPICPPEAFQMLTAYIRVKDGQRNSKRCLGDVKQCLGDVRPCSSDVKQCLGDVRPCSDAQIVRDVTQATATSPNRSPTPASTRPKPIQHNQIAPYRRRLL